MNHPSHRSLPDGAEEVALLALESSHIGGLYLVPPVYIHPHLSLGNLVYENGNTDPFSLEKSREMKELLYSYRSRE